MELSINLADGFAYEGVHRVRFHLVLTDGMQRRELNSYRSITEMDPDCVEFKQKKPSKKLSPTDYRACLKILIASGLRPNVIVVFENFSFLTFSTILNHCSAKQFHSEGKCFIEFPMDRVLPQAYELLYKWTMSERVLEIGCFDLLDTIDTWTYLYRNIGTDRYYDYVFDESLENYTAFLFFWEMKRRRYKYGRLMLNNRIKNCFLDLVANVRFDQLDITEVCVILDSSSIGVNTELEVFMAAIKWLSYDWNRRKRHVNVIMKCVRFKLMEPWLLTWLIEDPAIEVRRVLCLKSVDDLMQEAMNFHLAKLYFKTSPVALDVFRRENNILEPLQRSWTYDKNCIYHHRLGCPCAEGVTYQNFIFYMEDLRERGREYWKTFTPQKNSDCPCRKSTQRLEDFTNNDLPELLKFFEREWQSEAKATEPIYSNVSHNADGDKQNLRLKAWNFLKIRKPTKENLDQVTLTQPSHELETGEIETKATNDTEVALESQQNCNKQLTSGRRTGKLANYKKFYVGSFINIVHTDKYEAGLRYLHELVIDDTLDSSKDLPSRQDSENNDPNSEELNSLSLKFGLLERQQSHLVKYYRYLVGMHKYKKGLDYLNKLGR